MFVLKSPTTDGLGRKSIGVSTNVNRFPDRFVKNIETIETANVGHVPASVFPELDGHQPAVPTVNRKC